jgi:hypothetical protein
LLVDKPVGTIVVVERVVVFIEGGCSHLKHVCLAASFLFGTAALPPLQEFSQFVCELQLKVDFRSYFS